MKKDYIKPLIMYVTLVLITFLVIFIALKSTPNRLNDKINEYSKEHNISVEDIKKDKILLKQLEMEASHDEKIENLKSEVLVTSDEVENYRNMIGNSMDKKKAILILFNTYDECQSFIAESGGKETDLKSGIVPLMQKESDGSSYYNISGNATFESIFDTLKDGEYADYPISYSGMHCYLKRLSISSPLSDDKKAIEFIKNEKAQQIINGGAK